MELDPIAAIEACYAPAEDDRRWFEGILEQLAPLDGGLGLYAIPFDLKDPEGIGIANGPVAAIHPDERWMEAAWQSTCTAPPAVIRALYQPGSPVALASQQLKKVPPALLGGYAPRVRGDVLGIFAIEVDRRGILLSIPLPEGAPCPGPRVRHLLSAVAAHVLAGRRLRGSTADSLGAAPDSADAVLEPGGRVLDARGAAATRDARQALGGATRAIDRARSHARSSTPEEAVALWQGLVDGRWSLVDMIDTDGKRFVLARRNAPGVRDPKALTAHERDVLGYAALGYPNKHVAYVLGIAPSTVSAHLVSAQRKLGLRSRADLIRTFTAAS